MNPLTLLLDALKHRGGAALWTWVGLMLATWLVFANSHDGEISRKGLMGAGFFYAVVVLGVATLLARARARAAKPDNQASKAKKKKR